MLLTPGEDARVATRLILSRMVANYLMIGVWGKDGQLAGMARFPASSLHSVLLLAGLTVWGWLLQCWRSWLAPV